MKKLLSIVFFLLLFSCSKPSPPSVDFYHWKSNALLSQTELNALEQTKSNKLYLHYFDVDKVKESSYQDSGIYPISVIKSISPEIKNLDSIPVVFIVNDILKEHPDIKKLSAQIADLIDEIHLEYFGKTPSEIQIDCDWTATTQTIYFELLELLKKRFDVSVTIRLHQVKFQNRTGIPPVKKGVLMVYNIGDLDDFDQNSILQSAVVDQYINSQTKYPLELDIALPIFSQMVLKNNDGKLKLLTRADRKVLQNDNHFIQKSKNVFEVKKDTLYRGFYLYENFQIKLEEISLEEVIKSYELIKNSSLDINDIVLYHLDEKTLEQINLKYLIDNL